MNGLNKHYGRQQVIYVNPHVWKALLEEQEWDQWAKSLGPIKEKQVRLKRRLLGKKREVKKLNLPE